MSPVVIVLLMLVWIGLAGRALARGDSVMAMIYIVAGAMLTVARFSGVMGGRSERGSWPRVASRKRSSSSSRSGLVPSSGETRRRSVVLPLMAPPPRTEPQPARNEPNKPPPEDAGGTEREAEKPRTNPFPHGRGRPWHPSELDPKTRLRKKPKDD
jgi:hypothetical protein